MKFKANEIEILSNQMENIIKKIQQDFEDIKIIKNSLASNNYWQGLGAQHYNERFKNVVNQFDGILIGLNSNVDYLRKVTEGYKKLDTKVVTQAQNMLN